MSFWKRLLGREPSASNVPAPKPTSSSRTERRTVSTADDTASEKTPQLGAQWHEFFDNAPLHESARALVAFVGSWPKGLDPKQFSPSTWPSIVQRVRDHLSMPYPLAGFGDGADAPRPDYRMVDGKIARASNPIIDMVLCQVLPRGTTVDAEPHVLVWRLIERYSAWPLAKFLFLLPRIQDASQGAASGKAAVLVIEDMLIQVYKGVENTLFGAYDNLPEGGRLSDEVVDRKLRSLLTSARKGGL